MKSVAVGCFECHGQNAAAHKDSFQHNGFQINVIVSPRPTVCVTFGGSPGARAKWIGVAGVDQRGGVLGAGRDVAHLCVERTGASVAGDAHRGADGERGELRLGDEEANAERAVGEEREDRGARATLCVVVTFRRAQPCPCVGQLRLAPVQLGLDL